MIVIIEYRLLEKHEINQFTQIDNREIVRKNYRVVHNQLECFDYYCEIPRFSKENINKKLDDLHYLFDRGGYVYGAYDQESLVGLTSLDVKKRGKNKDRLQLGILHIHQHYRKQGIGKKLLSLCISQAKQLNMKSIYITGSPKKNTIDFYLKMGCQLATELEYDLYQKEPDDIHLDLYL